MDPRLFTWFGLNFGPSSCPTLLSYYHHDGYVRSSHAPMISLPGVIQPAETKVRLAWSEDVVTQQKMT